MADHMEKCKDGGCLCPPMASWAPGAGGGGGAGGIAAFGYPDNNPKTGEGLKKAQPTALMHEASKAMAIESTLAERGKRYGSFTGHAIVTQAIKDAMHDGQNWETLRPDMTEALEMIAHKIGRILNGDPSYKDSWHDIIGYAKLIEDTLSD